MKLTPLLLFAFAGCASIRPYPVGSYTSLGNEAARTPTCMSGVVVYASADKIPAARIDIALLEVEGSTTGRLDELRWLAARTGATGLALTPETATGAIGGVGPGGSFGVVKTTSANATAIYVSADSAKVASACAQSRVSPGLNDDDLFTIYRYRGRRVRIDAPAGPEIWPSSGTLESVTPAEITVVHGMNHKAIPTSLVESFAHEGTNEDPVLVLKLKSRP